MKRIKGAYEAIKLRYLLFIFAIATLIALPVRVYELLALVDNKTGFYTEDSGIIYLLYGVLLLVVGAFIILSFMSKEVPSPKLPEGKNMLLGVSSSILGVAFLIDVFSVLFKILPSRQAMSAYFPTLSQNVTENGGAFIILQLIFAILSIFYIGVYAISHLTGKGQYKEFKILALSPLCWAIARLVSKLMNAISFTSVSELLFEIIMLVFLMLFLLTFARITSGIFTEDSMWGIYGYGLSAALFAGLITIPRLVLIVVGRGTVEGSPFNFADIACLIFIVSYIFASLGIGFKSNREGYYENDNGIPEEDDNYEEEIIATNAGIPKRTDDSLPIITSRPVQSETEEKTKVKVEENPVVEVNDEIDDKTDDIEDLIEESNEIYSFSDSNPFKEDYSKEADMYSTTPSYESDVQSYSDVNSYTADANYIPEETPV
ncbi:MAG: hypothetical protein IKJ86_00365, partial [Clostridia bacterium]|nr:hypothetical protein [Clostridia bacterium]